GQLNFASGQLNFASGQLNFASGQLNFASGQLNLPWAQRGIHGLRPTAQRTWDPVHANGAGDTSLGQRPMQGAILVVRLTKPQAQSNLLRR
ncbi:MAG: hypothetical protein MUF54_15540, partial [Polyangiaceae bacterium]|nr:hypothetical protein [Polyangiaceae bacterium]